MSPSCTRRPSARAPATRLRRSRAMPRPRRTASSSRFESLISSPCCGSATPARWHQSAQDLVERSVGQATISLGVRGRRPPLKSGAATISNSSSNRRSRPTPSQSPLPMRTPRSARPWRRFCTSRLATSRTRQCGWRSRKRQARQQPVQAEGRHHRDHQLTLPWTRPHHPRGVGDLAQRGRVPAGRRTGRSRSGAGRAPRGRTGPGRGGFQQLDLLADR